MLDKSPKIFVTPVITNVPVSELYDNTVPSNRFNALVLFTQTTEFPVIYDNPTATVNVTFEKSRNMTETL